VKCIVNKGIVIAILTTILFGFAEGIGFGIKAGVNIANENIEGLQSRIGFCGGGFASVEIGDIIVIQPEVLYAQKGAKWERWIEPPGITTLDLDYVDIPLLVRFILPNKGAVKPNLFIGPYFAINVNASYRMEVYGTSEVQDLDEYYKGTDFGVVLGGGLDFLLKKGKIVLDGRYALGLTTISELRFDEKNRVISFMLGYSF
jgi:hypothetical protein